MSLSPLCGWGEARLCSAAVAGRACGCAEGPTGPVGEGGQGSAPTAQYSGPHHCLCRECGQWGCAWARPNACGSLGRILKSGGQFASRAIIKLWLLAGRGGHSGLVWLLGGRGFPQTATFQTDADQNNRHSKQTTKTMTHVTKLR